ncbi:MAG: hypothetical protein WCJ30_09255, partial [Deltaproteobacteria bacterium]
PMGTTGPMCLALQQDALNCGSVGNVCSSSRICQAGICVCRPGLSASGMTCVELSSDPANCGAVGRVCATGSSCNLGLCSPSCGPSLDPCGSACVNQNASPLHCGGCTDRCVAGTMCVRGGCSTYTPAVSSTACGSASCPAGTTCCADPGVGTFPVCVSGPSCV